MFLERLSVDERNAITTRAAVEFSVFFFEDCALFFFLFVCVSFPSTEFSTLQRPRKSKSLRVLSAHGNDEDSSSETSLCLNLFYVNFPPVKRTLHGQSTKPSCCPVCQVGVHHREMDREERRCGRTGAMEDQTMTSASETGCARMTTKELFTNEHDSLHTGTQS